jgi:rhomboid protease GluP
MTDAGWPARDKARGCARCGALNGENFDRCVRCGAALSARAASVDQAKGTLDGRSLLGTKILGGLTVLVFAGQLAAHFARSRDFPAMSMDRSALVPYGALEIRPDLVAAEPWRMLSAVFVHIGVIHIAANLLMGMASLSRIAEPAVGTARYVIAYVVTGIVGYASTVVVGLVTGSGGITAGASGSLFGVMGLVLGYLLRRRDPRWKQFAVQAVFFSVMFGFMVNWMNAGVLVNNSAHLGGLVSGVALGFLYAGPRKTKSDLLVNVGAALAVLACVASIALAQLSARGNRYDMPDPFAFRAAPPFLPPGPAPAELETEGREIVSHRTTV